MTNKQFTNKIVGFLITKEDSTPNIDYFNVGLKTFSINHKNFNIFLWGIGDVSECVINNKYSLSFPLNDNLLDRNVFISYDEKNIIIENDWLGSIPVFYNTKEKIISTIPLFCLKDKKINEEGLQNFCEFGYSVFEQTIFEDVKFMRFFSKILLSENNIRVEYKDDPVMNSFPDEESSEEDVITLMGKYIKNVESKTKGDIIIPTSGGYDSRLLNSLIQNKKRIRSFTYGISKEQDKSYEVVYAKKISEILNTKWSHIEIKNYNQYIDKWFEIYGFSTHLHGMYHIEFYNNIFNKNAFHEPTFLSGIIGDAWSDSGKFDKIELEEDVNKIGYSHGMNLDLKYLNNLNKNNTLKKKFFEENKENFNDSRLLSIFAMRTKIILLSYLTQIPEYFGTPTWTPFLNFEIATKTLNIKNSRRKNRIWQKDFFTKNGISLEDMNLKSTKRNDLNFKISKHTSFDPIDVNLVKKYISENRISHINLKLNKQTSFDKIVNELLGIKKIGGLLRRMGVKNNYLEALFEYYIIKTIEKSIKYES